MIFGLIGKTIGLFKSGGPQEPWMENEEAFQAHFGQSYEDFAIILANLDQAHNELYEKTVKVNPEAAVVWAFYISDK